MVKCLYNQYFLRHITTRTNNLVSMRILIHPRKRPSCSGWHKQASGMSWICWQEIKCATISGKRVNKSPQCGNLFLKQSDIYVFGSHLCHTSTVSTEKRQPTFHVLFLCEPTSGMLSPRTNDQQMDGGVKWWRELATEKPEMDGKVNKGEIWCGRRKKMKKGQQGAAKDWRQLRGTWTCKWRA